MYLLSLLLIALLGGAPVHDYHVSKTNLRYVADRQQLQVEMHLFVDDLEGAMQEAGAPRLRLGTPNEHAESERYLVSYLEKHFGVEWNGKPLSPTLVGYELDDDMHGLWIYLAVDDLSPATGQVTVQNSVLTEYYADQKNIVKLYRDEERVATLLLDRARTTESSDF